MRDPFKRLKLNRYERGISDAIERGEYDVSASKEKIEEARAAIEAYRKNAVLHMRINEAVLLKLKEKAKKLGVKYQTFIAEILRKVAHG
jgi:predicted DNA binding CopG/RHH family protein